MSRPKRRGKSRLNLDISLESRSRLLRIQDALDITSMTEVVQRALRVFEFVHT